jgi:tetratricopeptide (TPR) repeat protein
MKKDRNTNLHPGRLTVSAAAETRPRWERLGWLLIIVLALALRLVHTFGILDNPFVLHPRLDELFHDRWGESIARGNVLGDTVFFRAPLYPYFLGILYWVFGHSVLIPRFVQALLGTGSVFLVYLLGRRLFGYYAGIMAAFLAATYPVLIFYEGTLLFETLLTALLLASILTAEMSVDNASALWWFMTGLLIGLVCIARPVFLALVPLYVFSLYRRAIRSRPGGMTLIFVLLAGVVIVILPVTVRNVAVSGDPVLIASQGGINFYIGNNPEADGYTSRLPQLGGASWEYRDQVWYVRRSIGHQPGPSEESRFWYARGFDFIAGHPEQALSLYLRKLYLFWNREEIPNNRDYRTSIQSSTVLRLLPSGFWLVGPLGLAGIALALHRRRAMWVAGLVIAYSLVIALFFVCGRFRIPVVPLVSLFAGFFLVEIWHVAVARKWQTLVGMVVVLVGATLFVNSGLVPVESGGKARDEFALGLIALEEGRPRDAMAHFRSADSLRPGLANLDVNWGIAAWSAGDKNLAQQKFRQELKSDPRSYGALASMSALFLDERTVDSAVVYGRKAISVKPFVPSAYLTVARAYIMGEDQDSAVLVLQTGRRYCGEDFTAGEDLLAGLYLQQRKVAMAEQLYRDVLSKGHPDAQPMYEPETGFSEEVKMAGDPVMIRARAWYGLGHVFVTRGEIDSAVVYFRNATETSERYADAWADLGIALLQTRRVQESRLALERAVSLAPGNYLYWFNYGTVLGTMNDLAGAREAFMQCLQLNPDFAPARERLALVERSLR